ncbi:hypothetical protein JOC37_002582 [Desulfohalotomaculum tongense]|uniref:hypothetical protein n=1 Tax=Desulforadius tongensis TaxID=1216062 RepID=UPI00195E6B71|nr:hypothetical protein [Desulforadius tongensis]MBM7856150.1 hypothetical protein [Desulforadius tongensis]
MSKKSKPSFVRTLVFLLSAAAAYVLIFLNIEKLNAFYLSKHIIPAISLLGTIVVVSYLYGNAVSCILGHLGIDSDH